MIVDSQEFSGKNSAETKEPVYVAILSFDNLNTDRYAFTSSSAADVPAGLSGTIKSVLRPPSGASQKLDRLFGRSTIGAVSFEVMDIDGAVTSLLKTKLEAGFGVRLKQVQVWVGYVGLAFIDYRLIATQLVDTVVAKGTSIQFQCVDVQRFKVEKIFTEVFTQLIGTLAETDTVIELQDTSKMFHVEHGRSYSEHPAYSTNTVSVTNGSTAISATGALWQNARLDKDCRIDIDGIGYLITEILSETSGTITPAYMGTTGSKTYLAWPRLYYLELEKEIINATGKIDVAIFATGTDITLSGVDNSINSVTTDLSNYSAGQRIYLNGTTNADGPHVILQVPSSTKITLTLPVVTETPVGGVGINAPSQMYNLVRGALNTAAAEHKIDQVNTPVSRRTKVLAYTYLEMPAPKLAMAILTGTIPFQGGEVLPPNMHLNIDASFVDNAGFESIGLDLWDTITDEGAVRRFVGEKKQTGKSFLEIQVYSHMNCFSKVLTTGILSLQRLPQILYDSAYVGVLDRSNCSKFSNITYDMPELSNRYRLYWSYDPKTRKPQRLSELVDATSIGVHNEGKTLDFKMRGMSGARHTAQTLFNMFDSLRDAYSGPPRQVTVTALPSQNNYEIGDVVRLTNPDLRDHMNPVTGTLDSAAEVISVQTNWVTGEPVYETFGSTRKAALISHFASVSVLDDAFYSVAQGMSPPNKLDNDAFTGLTTSLIGQVLHITGGATLALNTDITDKLSWYWYDGAVTLDAGVTIIGNGNLVLAVRGFLQVHGTITLKGQGLPGSSTTTAAPGALGATQAGGALRMTRVGYVDYRDIISTGSPAVAAPLGGIPYYSLDNKGTQILGLPKDLRGSPGAAGGVLKAASSFSPNSPAVYPGGLGGDSGGGLLTLSRGMDVSTTGVVDLSGLDGGLGTVASIKGFFFDDPPKNVAAGAGGGGSPGGWLALVDGSNNLSTGLDERFIADQGNSPTYGTPAPLVHLPNVSLRNIGLLPDSSYYTGYPASSKKKSFLRIQKITQNEAPVADPSGTAGPPTSVSAVAVDNSPQSLGGNFTTVNVTVTAPVGDGQYSHANVYAKKAADTTYTFIGVANPSVSFRDIMDGSTYDIKAQSVSLANLESPTSASASVTVNNTVGGVTMGDGNFMAAGQTAFDVGIGYFLEKTISGARASFGDSTGDKLLIENGVLTLTGQIVAGSGIVGGFAIGANSLTAGSAGTTVGMDSGGVNPAFYAGSATPGIAPFRVTNTGVLTATNVILTGNITANAGSLGGWEVTATSIVNASGRIILDSANDRIRVQSASGLSYLNLDASGLVGVDSVLGTTINIPTNGGAPTFASGIINSTIFNITTSGILETSATVGDGTANSAGIRINDLGIQGFAPNSSNPSFALSAAFGQLTATDAILQGNGTLTITNANYGMLGIQLQHNAGTPRFYAGDGADKSFEFNGTDVLLGRDSKILGSPAYNNDNIYIEGYVHNMRLLESVTGTGVVTTNYRSTLLSVASGGPGTASVLHEPLQSFTNYTWAKDRRYKIVVVSNITGSTSNFHVGIGSFVSGREGLFFLFSSDGNIYGLTVTSAGTTQTLLQTGYASALFLLEIIHTASTSAEFLINNVSTATVTTNIPNAGTGTDVRKIINADLALVSGTNPSYDLYEFAFNVDP